MRWPEPDTAAWYLLAALWLFVGSVLFVGGIGVYEGITRTYTGEVTVTHRDHRPTRSGLWIDGRTNTPQNEPDLYRVRVCPTESGNTRRCWWREVPRSVYEAAPEGSKIEARDGDLTLPEGSRP